MSNYQRKKLSDGSNVGQPGPLPEDLMGLADSSLANLPGALDPNALAQLGYQDTGFFPVAEPAPAPVVSALGFEQLFTLAEREAIRTAAASNAQINDWLDLLSKAPGGLVHLDDPIVVAGVNGLVTAGLLTQARADAILAGTAPA